MRLPRLLLGMLTLTAGGAAAWVMIGVVRTGPESGTAGEARVDPASIAAVASLRDWDAGRARAWASADVVALRSLYTAGSAAGERDASMLLRWRDRGLRVEGMQTQIVATRVATQSRDRVVLIVTDRLAQAVAVGHGSRLPLPRDTVTTRRVTLRQVDGVWLVASVLPSAGSSAGPSTSPSAKP